MTDIEEKMYAAENQYKKLSDKFWACLNGTILCLIAFCAHDVFVAKITPEAAQQIHHAVAFGSHNENLIQWLFILHFVFGLPFGFRYRGQPLRSILEAINRLPGVISVGLSVIIRILFASLFGPICMAIQIYFLVEARKEYIEALEAAAKYHGGNSEVDEEETEDSEEYEEEEFEEEEDDEEDR